MAGLDYRGEYYYQFGNANGQKDGNVTTDADRDAYMFGLRLGKHPSTTSHSNLALRYGMITFQEPTMKINEMADEWQSFNTLWDTGHKFYGLQDVFLGVGGGGNTGTQGSGPSGFGSEDENQPNPRLDC